MNFNLPLNIQYPNGFILDYIQDEELYMYTMRFRKSGLNLYVSVGKNDFKPHIVCIRENGSNISLNCDRIVSDITLDDVFKRRIVVKSFKNLCPEFDFTKDEYTLQYHKKLVVFFKKFQQIVTTTLYHHPNLGSSNSMFWTNIKTLVIKPELLDLASILTERFKNDCMNTYRSDGEYHINFRHPILFGQLDYELAKKTIKEYYK